MHEFTISVDSLDAEVVDFSMIMKTDISGQSNRMTLIEEKIQPRYSVPVLSCYSPFSIVKTSAKVLIGFVSQVILGVEAGKKILGLVSGTLAKLKQCNEILTLLNKSTDTLGTGYYGYGQYGY